MLNQTYAPLLEAVLACASQNNVPFYVPGHKKGQGTPQELIDRWGISVFKSDLTELPELDNLFAPESAIQAAQELASEAFGAERTWFLINGTTCGIIAAIIASCHPGEKIILPRNVHKSAISGLILSGAIPIFINPEYDPVLDVVHSITPESVADTLQQHPDAKAVLMVYPTYYGMCGDVEAIAKITHQYNIPLLVDEAHGAHFNFHPQLPISALAANADLTVQSTHKVLGAMTQASMLHLRGNRIDRDRICQALALVQSTSPSYILLASLDAARRQIALHGNQLISESLRLADMARTQINQISGLSVLQLQKVELTSLPTPLLAGEGSHSPPFPAREGGLGGLGHFDLDLTRLTVTVANLGLTGDEADDILHQKLGITAELTSLKNITFVITWGNEEKDIERLVQAFKTLANHYRRSEISQPFTRETLLPSISSPSISPRDAFFAPTEIVAIDLAVNRLCAELVCPYPPGIPALMPGEAISENAIAYLKLLLELGVAIVGCSDPTLQTIKVLK